MNAFKYGCSVEGENFCARPDPVHVAYVFRLPRQRQECDDGHLHVAQEPVLQVCGGF